MTLKLFIEPPPPFAEGPGPGRDWWEKALSEKSFSGSKRKKGPQNQGVGARSRTTHLGPFGEVIRATGPMAKVNPFRFSTKYQDDETDFLYYGYRYYNPSTGRWPSRDPIGERGGPNLYGFVANAPTGYIDPFGLWQNEGSLDLLLTYLGINNSTQLAASMMADVENSSVVTSDVSGWLAQAQGQWKCGKSGQFINHDDISNYLQF